MEMLALERTLTELDHVRLTNLVHRYKNVSPASSVTLPIEQVLDVADVVPSRQLPPDIVTMRSRVLMKDLKTGVNSRRTLCFPGDADTDSSSVSVLSPVGGSLLGQRVGATVRWPTPSGGKRTAVILEILFQPESSGNYAM